MSRHNILWFSNRAILAGFFGFLLVFSAGCASTPSSIGERYQEEQTPEYQLVEGRFGRTELSSSLDLSALEREFMHLLYRTSCSIHRVDRDGPVTQIEFGRSGARGRVRIALEPAERGEDIYRYRIEWRVHIAQYPSTVAQDYQVNLIADQLVSTVERRDMLRTSVANNR